MRKAFSNILCFTKKKIKKFWEELAMLNTIFNSIFTETTAAFTFGQFLACTAVSLILGLLIAAVYRYKSECTKSFAVTLVLMPVIVQMVIMLVNGNLGTGVAVAGAFSLVRFRSAPGSAKEISSIFLAMAVGLATGMGFLGTAAAFAIIVEAVWFILVQTNFGEKKRKKKNSALPSRSPLIIPVFLTISLPGI